MPGSEKTNVGYSADLVIIDEAARTPAELVESMLPVVAVTGGSVIALTTPKGARGWFYSLWTNPDVEDVWERYQVTADSCPRITDDIIREARFTRGERHVQQEYYCSFIADEEAFFDPADLERSLQLADDEPLWFPERQGVA